MSAFASYQEWRDAIPWTDEQIAAVFDQRAACADVDGNAGYASVARRQAQIVRSGRLSNKLLSSVLADLITACAVCGKKALFRHGTFGFCRDHKHIKPSFVGVRTAQIEARRSVVERAGDKKDQTLRGLQSLRACRR